MNKALYGLLQSALLFYKKLRKDLEGYDFTKFATYLSSIYGKKLSVKRGKVHDYLGMDLDYTKKRSVKVSMVRYTGKVLRGFPEKVTGSAVSPAQDHLFKVIDESDPDYRPLTEDLAQSYHHATAQLLFMCSRARQDIQTAVAFLTTRVNRISGKVAYMQQLKLQASLRARNLARK